MTAQDRRRLTQQTRQHLAQLRRQRDDVQRRIDAFELVLAVWVSEDEADDVAVQDDDDDRS